MDGYPRTSRFQRGSDVPREAAVPYHDNAYAHDDDDDGADYDDDEVRTGQYDQFDQVPALSSISEHGGAASSGLTAEQAAQDVRESLDPAFLARSLFRRKKYAECVQVCDAMLERVRTDGAAQFYKLRALALLDKIDDTEEDEEGLAEMLMDDNAIAKAPRPGTSLRSSAGGLGGSGGSAGGALSALRGASALRPLSASGRPLTGFARPATQSRLNTAAGLGRAFQGARPGTSRPMSMAGRYVRLGTQSLLNENSSDFIDVARLNMRRVARKPALAKAVFEYLYYSVKNYKRAMELCAEATKAAEFKDWVWKRWLGKCYLKLGMLREAEQQLKSALRQNDRIDVTLELAQVYSRLDQPNTALELFRRASIRHPSDVSPVIGMARIHDALMNFDESARCYHRVLSMDASNVEAIASLAGHMFYNDYPERALRYYRRLLQMGVSNVEIWNNTGLCCFYTSQFDLTLACFEKALALADNDESMADVYYNIGHVAIGSGDVVLAYQAFKVAVSLHDQHAEAFCNLGVLELRRGNRDQARANFETAHTLAPHLFEPSFNAALLALKLGDVEQSFAFAIKSKEAFVANPDTAELLDQLRKYLSAA